MKITTLIGWPEANPEGRPEGAPAVLSCVLSEGDERREQAKVFTDAKQLHRFPKGIRCLAFTVVDSAHQPIELAVHISDEVTKQIADGRKLQLRMSAAQEAKANAVDKRKSDLITAHKRLAEAAVRWNTARDNLARGQQELNSVERIARTGGVDGKARLDEAREKLAELQKAETAAKADYDAAKKAKADLLNPPAKPAPTK